MKYKDAVLWSIAAARLKYEDLKTGVLNIIQDKNLPLALRWKIASDNQWALDIGPWCSDADFLDKYYYNPPICWYDDFGIDRHQTANFFDIMEDEWIEADWIKENPAAPYEKSETWTSVEDTMEAILQSGLKGFVNDW